MFTIIRRIDLQVDNSPEEDKTETIWLDVNFTHNVCHLVVVLYA